MTPHEAAAWMRQKVLSEGELYQDAAAVELAEYNDEQLAYYDDYGSLSIGKRVLAEFKKMTPDFVYSRREKYWRAREPEDEPGRMQP